MTLTRRTFFTGASAGAFLASVGGLALPATAEAATNHPVISMHHNRRHPAVRVAQRNLIRVGYDVGPWGADGDFGPATALAAGHLQTAHGLWRDNVIGSATWPVLLGAPDDKPGPDIDPRSIAYAKSEGAAVDISMKDRQVRYLTRRTDGSVRTHIGMEARFGGPNYQRKNGKALRDKPKIDWPTDKGAFRVYFKKIDEVSRVVKDSPMPFSVYYNGGEAVHYSPDFAAHGYAGSSHGCVNVRNRKQAERFFNKVKLDTAVIVH